jgi:predicted N-formylglutamate amidohydrolase
MNTRNWLNALPAMNYIILSCEHASNAVPPFIAEIFSAEKEILVSHRGYDIGAEAVFAELSDRVPLLLARKGQYTRLAIDCNRSKTHPNLFSDFTRSLSHTLQAELLKTWTDFRFPVQEQISTFLSQNHQQNLLHLSIHSFTPVLHGKERHTEIGLLYDPRSTKERSLAKIWKKNLRIKAPQCRVRLNYPYQGKSDGHTSFLRQKFGARYLGIEVEMNQAWLATLNPAQIAKLLADTLPTSLLSTAL